MTKPSRPRKTKGGKVKAVKVWAVVDRDDPQIDPDNLCRTKAEGLRQRGWPFRKVIHVEIRPITSRGKVK